MCQRWGADAMRSPAARLPAVVTLELEEELPRSDPWVPETLRHPQHNAMPPPSTPQLCGLCPDDPDLVLQLDRLFVIERAGGWTLSAPTSDEWTSVFDPGMRMRSNDEARFFGDGSWAVEHGERCVERTAQQPLLGTWAFQARAMGSEFTYVCTMGADHSVLVTSIDLDLSCASETEVMTRRGRWAEHFLEGAEEQQAAGGGDASARADALFQETHDSAEKVTPARRGREGPGGGAAGEPSWRLRVERVSRVEAQEGGGSDASARADALYQEAHEYVESMRRAR